jgi:hypothetical protein
LNYTFIMLNKLIHFLPFRFRTILIIFMDFLPILLSKYVWTYSVVSWYTYWSSCFFSSYTHQDSVFFFLSCTVELLVFSLHTDVEFFVFFLHIHVELYIDIELLIIWLKRYIESCKPYYKIQIGVNPLGPRDPKMGFWFRKFWNNFWSALS